MLYNKDVASNKVATLRSVQSRIANILCYGMLIVNNKNQQLQIQFSFARLIMSYIPSSYCYYE